MNDQTRINTLLDTVTELRAQLAATNAALVEKTKDAANCYKWWQESEVFAGKALTERDEYRRALDDATAKYDAAMKVVTK